MSKDSITIKARIVDDVAERFQNANSAIVVDYRGLTVSEVTDLRQQLRNADVSLSVIKNKILTRAADKAGYENLKNVFSGPTAIAFSNNDAIAPSKILNKFTDTHSALEIKGGMIEGKIVSIEEIHTFATLPSREELLAMIASALSDPMRKIARVIKAVADNDVLGNVT